AGRITDAEEDRLVFLPRFGESLVAPGIPVHGIVLVLQQVGRFLAREAVGVRVGHSLRLWKLAFRRSGRALRRKHRERCERQDNDYAIKVRLKRHRQRYAAEGGGQEANARPGVASFLNRQTRSSYTSFRACCPRNRGGLKRCCGSGSC